MLTNSLDDAVFGLADGSGTGIFESDLFSTVSLNGIDLGGYTIDSFSWTIDSYTFDAGLGQVSLASSLTVNGQIEQVPEPGTLAIFGIGLAALGMTRRRRKV